MSQPLPPTDDLAVLATAARWLAEGHKVALATVVEASGSAPRGLGSLLAIRADGSFAGSVSGGCVEGSVILHAGRVLRGRPAQLLEYGIGEDIGLACGGHIRVALLAADRAAVEAVLAEVAARRTVALAFDPAANAMTVVQAEGDDGLRAEEGQYLRVFGPAWRLVATGAVHVAQALAPMAQAAGYAVTVIDPRPEFATPERFPGVALIRAWPDEIMPGFGLDHRTALVALAHEGKLDDPALKAALAAGCFYIGALGSRATHAARRQRLAEVPGLDRIRGPVGLDIGARTPAEIAVAILAEVIAERRHKGGRQGR